MDNTIYEFILYYIYSKSQTVKKMYYPALFRLLADESTSAAVASHGADDEVKLDDDGSEAEYVEYHDDEYE